MATSALAFPASTDGSPVRMREINNVPNSVPDTQKTSPQQKSINLLPAVPIQASRKLSEREQRDCDVIGEGTTTACILSYRAISRYCVYIFTIFIGRLQKDS